MALYELDGRRPILRDESRIWVAESAAVIGDIDLAADVSIWFGAVLRGDNERITVGEGSNIQENCVLHTDLGFPMTIATGCTIGHGAILHGCTIGEGSLIGMGATVLNGAVIGAHSIVGANALVAEGKIFPDYSLIVGTPGKVVRTLDPDIKVRLAESSGGYASRKELFRTKLRRIG